MNKNKKLPFDYKKILEKVKEYVKSFDYKGLFKRAKSMNFKDPKTYQGLLKDKDFRKFLVFCVIGIVLFSFMRGCLTRPPKKVIPPRPVTTELVIQKDTPIYIESFGTLQPIYDVDIKAQVTGKVLSVHFKEGDEVSIGDPLFTIDPREYQAKFEEAEAQLAQDVAELKLKKDTLERNKSLLAKELISQQDFEEYETDVVSQEAQVVLDAANLDLTKINLGYCYIKSPINGKTGKRLVDPGNIILANTGPTLVNLKTVDPYYLDFTISERSLSEVRDAVRKAKLKVEIHPEEDDEGPYAGELVFMDNTVDDDTGTVALRALIPNKERKLWAGQFVTVRLILHIQKNATMVPYEAISIGQKGPYLFVVTKDNKADLRVLETGEQEEDYIIVNKGVEPGERVVTTGHLGLAPGVVVKDMTDIDKSKKKPNKKK